MKIMYKTNKWDSKITEVEIVRETPKQVIYNYYNGFGEPVERREAKESNYAIYHVTWEQARSYLAARVTEKIEGANKAIKNTELKLISLRTDGIAIANMVNPND